MRIKILVGVLALCLCCSLIPQALAQGHDVTDPACRALQLEVQAAVGDEDGTYRNHGAYLSAVSDLVRPRVEAGDIDSECASCIVNQFARRVAIADQVPCGPDSPDPTDPLCDGAECGTFQSCSLPNSCSDPVCATTADGLGVCVEGATPCAGLTLCPGGTGDCPAGNICAVNTCCGDPVCVPPEAFCEAGAGATASAASAPVPGTRTISGVIE